MQTILFLKGLPASGKSTFAKKYCIDNPEFKRLNKDDIREELGNLPFSKGFESQVLSLQRERGLYYLDHGFSIIIDDTNLHPKHYNYWSTIASERDRDDCITFWHTTWRMYQKRWWTRKIGWKRCYNEYV